MTLLIALVVGALVSGAVFLLLSGQRRRFELKRRLAWYGGDAGHRTAASKSSFWSRTHAVAGTVLERVGLHDKLTLALGRAGIDRSPAGFCWLVTGAGAAFVLLALIVAGPAAAIAGLVATPLLAVVFLRVSAGRRASAFESQLPELLDSLAAGLKAGHGFDHALQNAADDAAEPVASELKRVIAEVHLGQPLETALAELGDRVRSKDLSFVLNAISVQRQVGGSLAELFELVAETVRQREQFRRKLRAITGLPRISAKLLSALPLIVALLLVAVNRSYVAPLVTTTAGRVMTLITIAMIAAGSWMLRRIGTVEA